MMMIIMMMMGANECAPIKLIKVDCCDGESGTTTTTTTSSKKLNKQKKLFLIKFTKSISGAIYFNLVRDNCQTMRHFAVIIKPQPECQWTSAHWQCDMCLCVRACVCTSLRQTKHYNYVEASRMFQNLSCSFTRCPSLIKMNFWLVWCWFFFLVSWLRFNHKRCFIVYTQLLKFV